MKENYLRNTTSLSEINFAPENLKTNDEMYFGTEFEKIVDNQKVSEYYMK
jgi:hypothetical protein